MSTSSPGRPRNGPKHNFHVWLCDSPKGWRAWCGLELKDSITHIEKRLVLRVETMEQLGMRVCKGCFDAVQEG